MSTLEILDPFESVDTAARAIEGALDLAGSITMRLHGASMSPVIEDRDLAVVEKIPVNDLKAGDIVLLKTPDGRFIAHRLIVRRYQSDMQYFFTKGDNALCFDCPAAAGSILGKIDRVMRYGKPYDLDASVCCRLIRYWNTFLPHAAILGAGLTKLAARTEPPCLPRRRVKVRCLSDRLLLLLLRAGLDAHAGFDLRSLDFSRIDWPYLLDQAQRHKIASLIYQACGQDPEIARLVPAEAVGRLRNEYFATARKNVLLTKALEEIAGRLTGSGIRLMVLKGLWMAETVYQDPGARSSSDIDILVEEKNVPRVDALMRTLGYASGMQDDAALPVRPGGQRNSVLYYSRGPETVYCHVSWHLVNVGGVPGGPATSIPMPTVWQEARPAAVGRTSVWTLSPEHQIMFLCLHALSHSFEPAILLCDIRKVIGHYRQVLSWEKLIGQAEEYGISRLVFYALYLSRQLPGSEVPERVLDALHPGPLSWMERKIMVSVATLAPGRKDQAFVLILPEGGIRVWIYAAARLLFPAKQEMARICQKPVSEISMRDYCLRSLKAARYAFSLRKALLTH